MDNILITTTNGIDNYEVEEYLGVVNANFVAGTGFITDFFASVSDVLGGMSGSYQSEMDRLYERAKLVITSEAKAKHANAVLGYRVDFDEISGKGKSMFMISVTGTAVRLVKKKSPIELRVEQVKLQTTEQKTCATPCLPMILFYPFVTNVILFRTLKKRYACLTIGNATWNFVNTI